jgi:hypothetical protein
MAKYKVTSSTLWVDGIKYKRGDVVDTDLDFGTRVELYVEPAPVAKPKRTRKRTTKVEVSNED